ncbi:MAG: O-antigen ligase family protein [Flavobacteriales bacterium]|nr:O-antigen ligase family protein [Flavobacteriales bacterium]
MYASEYIDRITGHPIEGAPYYNHLFSSYLTWYVHPTYLAYYLVMALAAWTLADLHTPVSPTTSRIVLLVLALGIVLSSSKMGWIALSLLLPYVLFVNWGHAVLRRTILVTTVAAIGSFAVLYVTVGGVRGKVEEALAALKQEAPVAEDSSSARRQVWHAASELAIEAPWLGQGTGDVKNELIDRYDKHGYTYPLEHRLNAHSQFIQTLVALGSRASYSFSGPCWCRSSSRFGGGNTCSSYCSWSRRSTGPWRACSRSKVVFFPSSTSPCCSHGSVAQWMDHHTSCF